MPAKRHRRQRKPQVRTSTQNEMPQFYIVASALPGTEDLAEQELVRRYKGRLAYEASWRAGEYRFVVTNDTSSVLQLRLFQTIHASLPLFVKGPGSFMTETYYRQCLALIRYAMNISGESSWEGIRFDAAGSKSPTFAEFGARLSESFGIPYRPNDGDLLITVRPAERGWEFMCRIGSRPLSARAWRKEHFRGALNATLASAMVELSLPKPDDVFCNLMCGSGTLLVERLMRRGARYAVGVDISKGLLRKARTNAAAAGLKARVKLVRGTIESLPLPDAYCDVVCADLPWGEAVGERSTNQALYVRFFEEAHRIMKPGSRLVVLTFDKPALREIGEEIDRLFDRVETRTFMQRGYQSECLVLLK